MSFRVGKIGIFEGDIRSNCHPEVRRIFFIMLGGSVYLRRFFAFAQNDKRF